MEDSSNPRTFAGGVVVAAAPSAASHSSFSRGLPVPSAAIPPNGDIPAPYSLGGVVAIPPVCLSPEGDVSIGETFSLSRLFAMSSDNARFVPGEAPNKRVGCTSSSGACGRGRFGTRTSNVECSPLALVSRFGEPRESRPDNPGASTHVSKFLIPTPSPLPLTSTPESHDMLTLSTLPPITNVRGPRVRPRTPGDARHGADDCGRKEVERKRNEEKSWFCARENRKKRHDVCRSSLMKREMHFMFLNVKNVGASRNSDSFKTFQCTDGLVGYDVSFTRRRSGVRSPVGVFFSFV